MLDASTNSTRIISRLRYKPRERRTTIQPQGRVPEALLPQVIQERRYALDQPSPLRVEHDADRAENAKRPIRER